MRDICETVSVYLLKAKIEYRSWICYLWWFWIWASTWHNQDIF